MKHPIFMFHIVKGKTLVVGCYRIWCYALDFILQKILQP